MGCFLSNSLEDIVCSYWNSEIYFQDTKRQLISFMGYGFYITDIVTLNSKALELKQNLLILMSPFNISSYLALSTPKDHLPETIFPSRAVENNCTNLSFQHNITHTALDKLDDLSRSHHDEFLSNLSEFNILGLVEWMRDYADYFESCTSIYSDYISRVEGLVQLASNLTTSMFTTAGKFNFEVDSQVSANLFTQCFHIYAHPPLRILHEKLWYLK